MEWTNTGNAMPASQVRSLSQTIQIHALLSYRLAVGQQTQALVPRLSVETLKTKVDPARLQRAVDEGAVLPEASGLIEYWGNQNIAGLLLMPATRHNFVHLNEALQLKKRLS